MKLAKINVTVSVEAKNVLIEYQESNGHDNLDSALDAMLLGYVRDNLQNGGT
jgi:hypothetical protein